MSEEIVQDDEIAGDNPEAVDEEDDPLATDEDELFRDELVVGHGIKILKTPAKSVLEDKEYEAKLIKYVFPHTKGEIGRT